MHGETERGTVLYNKQFDKLLHDVSYGRIHSANSQPFGDWGAEENGKEKGQMEVSKGVSLFTIQPFSWEKSDFREITKVPVSRDL